MPKEKSAAILTIKDAPNLTAKGKRDMAAWLMRLADFLLKNHRDLSPHFVARYIKR